ncbi:hypothetical protein [Enterovibrio norvegicus]|uniref:hypothetical protein n=1 Tax=Enterovibrio norvegicus TaxID=188144 RepID=UPI0010BEFEBC|nr:hypothetical protein [Enterovibrio norvegicus]TKF30068.1 hypothetical protein FCV83_19930 [Enterovibrio norvegicus]
MKERIGFILAGSTPLDLIIPLVKGCKKFEYFVYCPKLTESQKRNLSINNIKFSTEYEFVMLNLPAFNVLITFGLLPHLAHKQVIKLCSLFKKIGGEVIDFQHGLFQWGINFCDNSIEQGFTPEAGISLPIRTLASEQLTWFGENGLGIPKIRYNTENSNFTLIVTNTNWHVYKIEEKIRLARIIYYYVKENPNIEFVWKPHPAEFNVNLTVIFSHFCFDDLPNLKITTHGEKGQSLEELISTCNNIIATVGSSLIDAQIYNKPTTVYRCSSMSHLISQFKCIESFDSLDELREGFGEIFYDEIKFFDVSVFTKIVKRRTKEISYSDYLAHVGDELNA